MFGRLFHAIQSYDRLEIAVFCTEFQDLCNDMLVYGGTTLYSSVNLRKYPRELLWAHILSSVIIQGALDDPSLEDYCAQSSHTSALKLQYFVGNLTPFLKVCSYMVAQACKLVRIQVNPD